MWLKNGFKTQTAVTLFLNTVRINGKSDQGVQNSEQGTSFSAQT